MSIFDNAIDSIQMGIEDYKVGNRRSVSSVRNIFAGMLLLYKEKLCELSPDENGELLIKQYIRPTTDLHGDIVFEGKGKKTVDVQAIKDRFKSLNISVDWKRFDEINDLRNDLEHYYTTESPDAVREIIAKSFLLIRNFMKDSLELDAQEYLGTETWTAMLDANDLYTSEYDACKSTIDKIEWEYESVRKALEHLRCNKCHSSLVSAPCSDDGYPDIGLSCRNCGHEFCFGDVVEQIIDDELSGTAIYNVMKGGESPYDACPECDKNTFVHEEEKCVACEYEFEYTLCSMCESSLGIEDQYNDGMCSYCSYKLGKQEDE